jgi:hypothetical protein
VTAPLVKHGRLARLVAALAAALACIVAPAHAAAPPGFFGTVAITPLDNDDFSRMDSIGSDTLRFLMPWSSIQHTRNGGYDWSGPDAMVVRAQKSGTRLLPILIGTPKFLAPCGSRSCSVRLPVYKSKQRNAWQDFLQAAVKRYEPGGVFWQQHPFLLPQNPITDWQVWNEENNDNVHAKPKDYAKLVEISDEAIKATDPGANLVLGGLAGNVSNGHPHPTAQAYLDDLYKFMPKSSFDEVALHPYAQTVSDVAGEIKGVRRAMQKHHDANRRLLITEIGWGSGAPKEQHEFVLTPKGQKQRLLQSFKLLLAHRSQWHLAGVYWFDWRDPAPGKGLCGFCYSSGLLKHSGTAKPSFEAFKHFVSP